MTKIGDFGGRLYRGESSYDIVGSRRRWYMVSAVLILLALVGIGVRGLNLGIEFKGGRGVLRSQPVMHHPGGAHGHNRHRGRSGGGHGDRRVEHPGADPQPRAGAGCCCRDGSGRHLQCGVEASDVQIDVGPTWGSDVSRKALQGLIVFLILVTIFLSIYFEWRMAVAALVALAHDLIITIGIYSLLGFEVTPATAIGVLTILGYSLYDTVVVFDKVKENTKGVLGQSRLTYAESANLAVNQTLIRSINTSIVALLPVGAILFVGSWILGAGTLKDLALALFVGMAAGTYSSICVATPILVQLKEREPEVQALERRVNARRRRSTDHRGQRHRRRWRLRRLRAEATWWRPASDSTASRDPDARVQPKRTSRTVPRGGGTAGWAAAIAVDIGPRGGAVARRPTTTSSSGFDPVASAGCHGAGVPPA